MASFRSYSKFAGYPKLFSNYKLPVPGPTKPHPLPGGIESVRAAGDQAHQAHHLALVGLCGLAGLRISEALSVHKKAIDLKTKSITVRGKGDKTRTVPMSDECWDYIRVAYENCETVLVPICDSSARRFLKRASFGNPSHDYRATFATQVHETTKDMRIVQDLLGHASLQPTQTYVAVNATAKREAVNFQ